jgi:hypothetical protein
MSHISCHHQTYYLTCSQFDAMLARADGHCERCGTPFAERFHIDHDHQYDVRKNSGVRGLVCPKCNSHLDAVDRRLKPVDSLTRTYIDASWCLTEGWVSGYGVPRSKKPSGISSTTWAAAMQKATERQESLSAVIRTALERYTKDENS